MRVATPAILLQRVIRCDQSSPGWIQMDVIADRPQVFARARIHQDSLVAPGENVTPQLMPGIVALRVCSEKPLHPRSQIGARRLDHDMEVIAYQAPGMHLPRVSACPHPPYLGTIPVDK